MSANTDIIEAFCRDRSSRDMERLMSYFAEDAEYYNSPIGAVKGTEAIAALLRAGWACDIRELRDPGTG